MNMKSYALLIYGEVNQSQKALASKLSKKTRTKILVKKFSKETKELGLIKNNQPLKIYINAHGLVLNESNQSVRNGTLGNLSVRNDALGALSKPENLSIKELANILANNLASIKISESNSVTISLIVCYAGYSKNDNPDETLAANLQRELKKHNIYVNIEARIPSVSFDSTGDIFESTGKILTVHIGSSSQYKRNQEELQKLLEPKNKNGSERDRLSQIYRIRKEQSSLAVAKQPSSKIIYQWQLDEKGEPTQVVYDAYWLKKQKACQKSFNEAVKDIRHNATKLLEKAGSTNNKEQQNEYKKASSACTILADELEGAGTKFFDKSLSTTLTEFQQACENSFTNAEILKNHRNPQWRRNISKTLLVLSGIATFGTAFLAKGIYSKVTTGKFTIFRDITKSQGKLNKARTIVNKVTEAPRLNLSVI